MDGLKFTAAAWQAWASAIVLAGVAFGFVWEKWNRGLVAAAGALLLIVIGAAKWHHLASYIDWPMLALVVGMTAMAGVAQKAGLPAYAAVKLMRAGKGSPRITAALLVALTGAAGALLDSVAAVLTLVPVGLQLGALLGIKRGPLLFGQMLAAAIGGAATMNGSPVNMMIAAEGHFTYLMLLLHVGLPAALLVALMAAAVAAAYPHRARPDLVQVATEWRPRAWQRDPVLLRNAAIALGAAWLAFALHHFLPVHPGWVALAVAVVLVAASRKRYDTRELVDDADWRTLLALAGLFVIGGALADTGAAAALAHRAAELSAGSLPLLAGLTLWLSAVLAAALGPLPVAALLVQLVPALGAVLPEANAAALHPLWWALALGTALGAAATPLGAPGHVAALTLAARTKEASTAADFLKWSIPAAFAGLMLATVYLLLL
jgi:Na+/H+ antiporter NhaD/arsenite permease-like protein